LFRLLVGGASEDDAAGAAVTQLCAGTPTTTTTPTACAQILSLVRGRVVSWDWRPECFHRVQFGSRPVSPSIRSSADAVSGTCTRSPYTPISLPCSAVFSTSW
jgi:hypothetical protein